MSADIADNARWIRKSMRQAEAAGAHRLRTWRHPSSAIELEKPRPLTEAGIVKLTEGKAPAFVLFADGQTQQGLMVRLDEPATGQ